MTEPREHQYPLPLADRQADEILRERLEELVCRFNSAEGDPARRCELHAEMTRLRRLLGIET